MPKAPKVELDCHPADAPCCIKLALVGPDEEIKKYVAWAGFTDTTALIQTDWEWPALAKACGWGDCHCDAARNGSLTCKCEKLPCSCGKSDGTVDCPDCKILVEGKKLKCTASRMIQFAREYLDSVDGQEFELEGFEHYFPQKGQDAG